MRRPFSSEAIEMNCPASVRPTQFCPREIQPVLIKIKMDLLIGGKCAGDFFDGFELSFIQFYALALNCSHASCVALIAFSALCFAARLP